MQAVGAAGSSNWNSVWSLQQPNSTGANSDAGASDPILSELLTQLTGQGSGQDAGQASGAFWQNIDPSQSASASGTTTSGTQAGGVPCSPAVMGALIAAQELQSSAGAGQPAPLTASTIFSNLDSNGDGAVSKSEIESLFGSGNTSTADAIFNKLDANGDGSVSESELASGLQNAGGSQNASGGHHHHHMGGGQSAGGSDPLSQLLSPSTQGATTATATNANGSTTTTITYADGSTVSTTSAAPTQSSASAAAGTSGNTGTSTSAGLINNLLEQLIQMQAQLVSPTSSTVATA